MNEETILNVNPAKGNDKNEKKELNVQNVQEAAKKLKKKGKSWANVTLGGVSAILLGAGSAYGAHSYANGNLDSANDGEQQPSDDAQQQAGTVEQTAENAGQSEAATEQTTGTTETVQPQQPAFVNDNQAFAEAFAAARAELGNNATFEWNGRIYSTSTVDEWNAMSEAQQTQIIDNAGVTTSGVDIVNNPQGGSEEPIEPPIETPEEGEPVTVGIDDPEGDGIAQTGNESGGNDDDVHVVGISEQDGHLSAQVDLNNDGESDITIVDVDDNETLSDPDIIIDNEGNTATIAELNAANGGTEEDGSDTYLTGNTTEGEDYGIEEGVDSIEDDGSDVAYLDNPEVADGMPDYMNDAII